MSEGLRERKKAATRDALAQAALSLAVEHGFDHVSVEAIAAAADVSPRTFFNYFTSKEEAVLGSEGDWLREVAAAFAQRPAGEPLPLALGEALLGMLAGHAADLALLPLRHSVVCAAPTLMLFELARFASLEDTLHTLAAARSGLPSEHPYPSVVAASVAACLRLALVDWTGIRPAAPAPIAPTPPFDDLAERLRTRLRMLSEGLGTPPDRA